MVSVRSILAGAAIAAAPVPADAVTSFTYSMGGTAGNVASITVTPSGAPAMTVTARTFAVAPAALTSLSQLSGAANVNRTALSIGVQGGANAQLDTNIASAREAWVLTVDKPISIRGGRFSWVDTNDTLRIFGVNADNSLTPLIDGHIGTGLGGAASVVLTSYGNTDSNIATLALNTPLAAYSRFVMTTGLPGANGDGGQGYRLNWLDAAVVPEPATWAMLILGFGLVGSAMRRRAARPVAAR